MEDQKSNIGEIDNYIAEFPVHVQMQLEQIRAAIAEAAPGAKEVISYKMPAFKMKSVLVYFAAYEKHIGFYPTSSGIEMFKNEFIGYKWSKGAVQFPIDQPLPVELIRRIVKFRVEEDNLKSKKK